MTGRKFGQGDLIVVDALSTKQRTCYQPQFMTATDRDELPEHPQASQDETIVEDRIGLRDIKRELMEQRSTGVKEYCNILRQSVATRVEPTEVAHHQTPDSLTLRVV